MLTVSGGVGRRLLQVGAAAFMPLAPSVSEENPDAASRGVSPKKSCLFDTFFIA